MGARIIPALSSAPALWLCALLALAPLPFGSVTILWRTALWIGCFVALGLAALSGRVPRRSRPALLVLAPIACLAGLGLLQGLALPDAVVGLVSPAHLGVVERARELLGSTEAPRASLSLAPSSSWSTALGLLASASVFWAAVTCGADRRRRWWLLWTLVATALLEVFFGAQHLFARAATIWGVEVPGATDRLRGTFVNADHLALYLQMALAAAFGWSYFAVRRSRRELRPEYRLFGMALPVICWLVLFVGLSFTGSRAGLVAALVAVAAQGVLLAAALRSWRIAPAGIVAGILALGAVAWVGLEQGLGRLLATSSYEAAWNARPLIYGASLDLWTMFPWLGTGLGTFEAAFPMVQPVEIGGRVWSHAHNDWLEVLVTTGLLGFGLLLAAVLALVSGLRTILLGSISSSSRAFALAALGAVIAVGLHEALDFGLTMPANAVTLAVLSGAALGSARDYEESEADESAASEGSRMRLMSPGEKGR